jgi:hypothetical protein
MSTLPVRAFAGSIVVVFLMSMNMHGTAIDEMLARRTCSSATPHPARASAN